MTNPKSEAPSGWVPRIGDVVEWDSRHWRIGEPTYQKPGASQVVCYPLKGGDPLCIYKNSLRLVSPAPPADAQVEMYGTMPSELPETLPVGTPFNYGGDLRFHLGARLDDGGYVGPYSNAAGRVISGGEDGRCQARHVDWTKVPRPPNPAPVEEWFGFRKGERVRYSDARSGSTFIVESRAYGPDDPHRCLLIRREDGPGNSQGPGGCYFGKADELIRASEPAKNASNKRGPEARCPVCREPWDFTADRCTSCPTTAASCRVAKNANARHCDKCMNPVDGGTLCAEHIKALGKPVDPYVEHRLSRPPFLDENRGPGESLLDNRVVAAKARHRHEQALAQLRRTDVGAKYAETSTVFSTATWEED